MPAQVSALSAENPEQFVVTMAMDAFRLCLGKKPRNHSLPDVIRWMKLMNATEKSRKT